MHFHTHRCHHARSTDDAHSPPLMYAVCVLILYGLNENDELVTLPRCSKTTCVCVTCSPAQKPASASTCMLCVCYLLTFSFRVGKIRRLESTVALKQTDFQTNEYCPAVVCVMQSQNSAQRVLAGPVEDAKPVSPPPSACTRTRTHRDTATVVGVGCAQAAVCDRKKRLITRRMISHSAAESSSREPSSFKISPRMSMGVKFSK